MREGSYSGEQAVEELVPPLSEEADGDPGIRVEESHACSGGLGWFLAHFPPFIVFLLRDLEDGCSCCLCPCLVNRPCCLDRSTLEWFRRLDREK